LSTPINLYARFFDSKAHSATFNMGPFQRTAKQDNSFLLTRQFMCMKKNIAFNGMRPFSDNRRENFLAV
jgi:hypothetical protein